MEQPNDAKLETQRNLVGDPPEPAAEETAGREQPPKLRGLQRLCRAYGRMKCGEVMMVWDYVLERAVPESEMPGGSERWMASERKRWQAAAPRIDP